MAFRGDDRAQTVQIGAVLLFATIIIALSLYQATVVPQENQQVEFAAYQEASADMLDLRNALLSTASGDGTRAVTFKTGARYPSRTFLMNGLDPAGTVSTTAAANVTLGNVDANATAFENVGAYVANESHELNYTSRQVRFDPAYNHISPASLVTTNGFVYRTHDNATQLAPQTLVRGNTITLTTIVGSLDASGYNTPITAVPVSAHVNTVTVTNQSAGPLNLTLPTQLNASEWNETVLGTTGTQLVQDVTDGPRPDTVTVQLEANEQYELEIARVELRERDDDDEFTDPDARYLVAETDRETAVNDDGRVKLVVEARDALNNPRSNWPVTFNTSGGQLETRDGTALGSQRTVRSNEEGDAILWFDKAGSGDATVRATLGTDTTGGAEETVEWTVSDAAAGGGGGGGSGDTTGPAVTSASASPSTVAKGGTVTLSATVSDIDRGGLDIQSGEWFHANASETVAGADPGTGNANPLSFVNRDYYAREDLEATGIDTSTWESGNNTLAVRGLDTNGNWGPLVTRTVTVVVSNPLITAVQPNPDTLSDTNGEFIQVRIPNSLNTSGWTLLEQDASWTIPSDVNGTHYFVRDEASFTSQWGVDSANVTQWNGLILDNGGQTIELEDETGALLDRFSYGNGDGQQFANSSPYDFSANGGQAGQIAYRRTDASGDYIDTDAASDWNQTGESAYFNPPSVSAVTLGNDGSGNVSFSFDSNQSLSDITVTVDGPNTTDVYMFTKSDFTETESGGTYTYTLATTQAYDDGTGTYTATVDDAVNTAGKNGGENGQGSGLSDSYSYSGTGGSAADVAYINQTSGSLETVDSAGEITTFAAGANVETVGSTVDIDGDPEVEVTYVTSSGNIRYIDKDDSTPTTLLSSVNAKKAGIAAGSWNGSPTSVFFANNNDEDGLYRKEVGGTRQLVATFSQKLRAVIGIGDVDDDGSDEIVTVTNGQKIAMLDDDGTTYISNVQPASSSGLAIGAITDYNGDGQDRVAIIDGSNNPKLVGCGFTGGGDFKCNRGKDGTVTFTGAAAAKKAPFGAGDIDGDSRPEVVYAENVNSPAELYNISVTGDSVESEGYVTDSGGSRITINVAKGVAESLQPPPVTDPWL
jgi:hypothetical protein